MVSVFKSIQVFSLIFLATGEYTFQFNASRLMDILVHANKYQEFHTIPILAAYRTLFDLGPMIQQIHTNFERPVFILSQRQSNFLFRFSINRESLTLVFFGGVSEIVFEMAHSLTRGKRLTNVLFILTHPVMAQSEVTAITSHILDQQYMKALLLYTDFRGRDHLTSFSPCSAVKIKNALNYYRDPEAFFLTGHTQLNGYKVRAPLKFDLPRVYSVTEKGRKVFKGYGYQLFMLFLEHVNATFEEMVMNSSQIDIKGMIRMAAAGEIQISLHPSSSYGVRGIGSSYPIRLNDVCIMIPMSNEIPAYMYLWSPLQSNVWILLVFATFYLAFTHMWIHPTVSFGRPKEFGWSLLRSIGYMLNTATGEYHHNVTWRYFFVDKTSWVLGFFVSTWYCTLLESYLTTTVFGPQIDTLDELIQSGLKIPVPHYEIDEGGSLAAAPRSIRQLFIGTDEDEVARLKNGFDTSYAYVVATDRWTFLRLQQQFARRPVFRLSHICFMKHFLSYQITYDTCLQYALNYFILELQQTGLLIHLYRLDFRNAVREGYVSPIVESYEMSALHGESLRLAWDILAIGLGISGIVFIIERLALVRWNVVWLFLGAQYAALWEFVAKFKPNNVLGLINNKK